MPVWQNSRDESTVFANADLEDFRTRAVLPDLGTRFPRHALIVVVFFGIIAYLMCTSRTRRCWRCATFALCAATVLAVGFSRLYLDMHWLSDVGGGFAIGFGYLLFTIRLVELVPAPARVTRRPTSEDASLSPS